MTTITDNRKKSTVTFSNIDEGEIFFSPQTECFYIRMQTLSDGSEDEYNAVELFDGFVARFGKNETVEKVNANITITNT